MKTTFFAAALLAAMSQAVRLDSAILTNASPEQQCVADAMTSVSSQTSALTDALMGKIGEKCAENPSKFWTEGMTLKFEDFHMSGDMFQRQKPALEVSERPAKDDSPPAVELKVETCDCEDKAPAADAKKKDATKKKADAPKKEEAKTPAKDDAPKDDKKVDAKKADEYVWETTGECKKCDGLKTADKDHKLCV